MIHLLVYPFIKYNFMSKALISCFALSISTTPLGCFLLLRRMSLLGDALSHAILPGVAIGYLLSNMSFIMMSIGGFISGVIVIILSNWISNITYLKEDASFSGFYLSSLALGVILISIRKSNINLLHLLFGSILSINNNEILLIGMVAGITCFILSMLYRVLIIESFDVTFLQVNYANILYYVQALFLTLVVLNLVAGYQIFGTLMSIGLMMLPSVSARCWTSKLSRILLLATFISILCSYCGLLWSFYTNLPAGPTIILVASIIFYFSILFSPRGLFMIMLHRYNRYKS